MKPKSLAVVVLLGLALGGAVVWAFRARPVAVDVARVTRGPLVVTVDEEGRTRIRQRYVVSAPLAGRLARVELRPGDAVEAGRTVVATIEPAAAELLDPRARALAEARLKSAEAGVARSGTLQARAEVARAHAATELVRAQDLFRKGGLSHQELDAAEVRAAETESDWRAADFAARMAGHERDMARAALAEGDEAGPGATREVRAPVGGRVLRVFQESATVVAPGARLLEIGDPADLEVVVEALSTDAVRVGPGTRVLVEQWGGDEPLAGRVRVVEPAGFTKVSALGVEEQRVNVIVDFAGPASARRALGDGFRVEVRMVVWEGTDVRKVPGGALFREGDAWAVFVVEGGRAVRRAVELGRRGEREAEVRSGPEAGALVVVHPGDRVRPGARVAPR